MTALVPVTTNATTLANLAEYARQADGAFAPNTERAVKSDTAIFSRWCSDAGLSFLPASPETVAGFIDAMAASKAPATIRRYVASIGHWHRGAKLADPATDQAVKLALKRMHRARGRAQQQAAPLNRAKIDAALTKRTSTPRDLRNRAVLALAYDTLCRRSELVALRLADLQRTSDGSGTILIRQSKTDQEGEGMVRYVAADTMAHLEAWIAAAGLIDGPLFRAVLKGGKIGGALHACEVPRIFKELAGDAAVSGHSARVGAAQDMVKASLGVAEVMQAGGWQSATMVSRYTKHIEARRSGAARLAAIQGR
jgi:integrase